jgi:beta-lactamase regulating signal transducer with metallopeptidase domain/protocatechuate 3,4-dioxygenase beta subunit
MPSLPFSLRLLEFSAATTAAATSWFLQSTVIIAVALVAARLVAHRGPALRSAIYRATLVAVLVSPLATWLISSLGLTAAISWLPTFHLAVVQAAPLPAAAPEPPALATVLDSHEDRVESGPLAPTPQPAAESFADAPVERFGQLRPRSGQFPGPLAQSNRDRAAQAWAPPAPVIPEPTAPKPAWVVQPAAAAFVTAISTFWLVGTVFLLARLLIDYRRMIVVCRAAHPVDLLDARLCRELSAKLTIAAPRLLRTPYLSGPCLTGIWRPTILLPEESTGVSLSSILVHELAHLKRGDCRWNLVRQFARAVLFFQPLLWRLSRRLEESAEEVCDDHVVHWGEDRTAYAAGLVQLAERTLVAMPSASVPLVTFRSLLGQRVGRILDRSHTLSLRAGLVALSLVIAAGLTITVFVGLFGPATRSDAASSEQKKTKDAKVETPADGTKHIAGKVLGPDGKPAAGANFILIARKRDGFEAGQLSSSSQIKILHQARAGAGGKFDFSFDVPSSTRYLWLQLLVRSDSSGLAWREVNVDQPRSEFTIDLPEPAEARGRLVTLEGQPVAGVKLTVDKIGSGKLGEWHGPDSMRAALPAEIWPTGVITDADGWFTVKGVPADAELSLHISQEPYAPEWWMWKRTDAASHTKPLSPAQIIIGTVVAADTGKPIPLARLTAFQADEGHGRTGVDGQADAEGRFRLNPFPAKSFDVSAFAPPGSPCLAKKLHFEWPEAAKEHDVRLELPRGVLLRGRVVDEDGGKPPAGAKVTYEPTRQGADETVVNGWQAQVTGGDDGSFAIPVPAGSGFVTVQDMSGDCVLQEVGEGMLSADQPRGRRMYVAAYAKFEVPEGSDEFPLELKIHRGKTVQCEISESDGSAPDLVLLLHRGIDVPYSNTFRGFPREIHGPRFEVHGIPTDGELPIYLLDPIHKQGKTLVIHGSDTRKPLKIQLEPCASATIRFLNSDGKPVRGHSPSFYQIVTPGVLSVVAFSTRKFDEPFADADFISNVDRRNHWDEITGEDGRITLSALIPGAAYQLLDWDDKRAFVAHELKPQPGEHVDLPDLTLRGDDILRAAEEEWMKRSKLQGILKAAAEAMKSAAADGSMHGATAGLPSSASGDKPNENTGKASAATEKPKTSDSDPSLSLRGLVVAPDGKPVAGAKLFVVCWNYGAPPANADKLRAVTNTNGVFEFTLNRSDLAPNADGYSTSSTLVATAEGYGAAIGRVADFDTSGRIKQHPPTLLERAADLLGANVGVLHLVSDDPPLTGRILSVEGQPLAGVTVALKDLESSESGSFSSLGAWEKAAKDPKTDYGSLIRMFGTAINGPLERFVVPAATTGPDGRFTMPGIGRDRIVELTLSGPGLETRLLCARTRAGEKIVVPNPSLALAGAPAGRMDEYYPNDFTFVLAPSSAIVGTVTDLDTGKPLAGITVLSQKVRGNSTFSSGQDYIRTTTDADGRYRLEGMPLGDDGEIGVFTTDQPYPPFTKDVKVELAHEPIQVDFKLTRGVWVDGRVRDSDTGRPLSGSVEYFIFADNIDVKKAGRPSMVDSRAYHRLDSDGRFRIAALPGRGIVGVWVDFHPEYARGAGAEKIAGGDTSMGLLTFRTYPYVCMAANFHVLAEVNPSAGADPINLDLKLSAGAKVIGKVIDSDGRPVTGALYTGDNPFSGNWALTEQDSLTVSGYQPAKPRQIVVWEPERKLSGLARLTGDPPQNFVVKIGPTGSIRGRIVDQHGTPLAGVTLSSDYWPPPTGQMRAQMDARGEGPPPLPPPESNINHMIDDEGRFEIHGLIPGQKYGLGVTNQRTNYYLGVIPLSITVAADETKDLGSITPHEMTREEIEAQRAVAPGSAGDSAGAAGNNSASAAKHITGAILSSDAQPAAHVPVILLARPRQAVRRADFDAARPIVLAQAQSNASGHFDLSAANLSSSKYLWVQLVARSADSGLTWQNVDADSAQASITLKLPKSATARGRLVTLEGQPVPGMHIQLWQVAHISQGNFDAVEASGAKLPPDIWPNELATDADGWFTVPGMPQDAELYLSLDHEPYAPEQWHVAAAEKDPSKCVKTLAPAQIVKGVVVAADTGKPVAGAKVSATTIPGPMAASAFGTSDAQGRFRVSAYTAKSYIVTAHAPQGTAYLAHEATVNWGETEREHEVKIELPPGVLVTGKIVEQGSGQPIAGATVRYAAQRLNPFAKGIPLLGVDQPIDITDAQGHFAIAIPAGRGTLTVKSATGEHVLEQLDPDVAPNPYGRRLYVNAHAELDLAADARQHWLDLALTRGVTVKGQVVRSDGSEPKSVVWVHRGLSGPYSDEFPRDDPEQLLNNRFEIHGVPPAGEAQAVLLDPLAKQGKLLVAKGSDAEKPLRVELQPCGSLDLQYVDADGKPVAGMKQIVMIAFTSGASQFDRASRGPRADETFVANFDRTNCWDLLSDENGRITIPTLVPGVTYRIGGSDDNGGPKIYGEVVAKPGEQIQFPDIVVRNQRVLRQAEAAWLKRTSAPSAAGSASAPADQPQKSKENTGKSATQAASPTPDNDLLTIQGRVLDPAGKPVSAADVLAIYWHYPTKSNPAPLATSKSDSSGRFELAFRKSDLARVVAAPPEWKFVQIVAVAPGFGPAWATCDELLSSSEPTLKLAADQPIEGRIESLEGRPIAGARVVLEQIETNDQDDISGWLDAIRRHAAAFDDQAAGHPGRWIVTDVPQLRTTVTTDGDGRFRLAGIGRNREAMLVVTGPSVAVARLNVATREMEPLVADIGNAYIPNQPRTIYGAAFRYAAEPSQTVEGVVRDAKTREPLAGIEIRSQELAGQRVYAGDLLSTVSDAQGRFRLEGMPKGEGNRLLAVPSDDQPYFSRQFDVPTAPSLQVVKADLDLNRGTWIRGRVFDKSTGRPVRAHVFYLPWPDNPNIAAWAWGAGGSDLRTSVERFTTDEGGNYRIVGLPGRGLVATICLDRPFPFGQGRRDIADLPSAREFRKVADAYAPSDDMPTAIKEVNIAGADQNVSADLPLDPGKQVTLNIVDPAGKPLTDVVVAGLAPKAYHISSQTVGPAAKIAALAPDEKRLVLLHHKDRNLGKALRISAADGANGPIQVMLEPCATLTGRLLDKNGAPIRGQHVEFGFDDGNFSRHLPEVATDMDGRFTNRSILPGEKCSASIGFDYVAQDLAVRPGESIDLSEFDVTKKERPEPKRTMASGTTGPASAILPLPRGEGRGEGAAMASGSDSKDDTGKASATQAASSPPDADLLTIHGRVLDPAGKPLAAADVLIVRWHWKGDADRAALATAKSDPAGNFTIGFRKSQFNVDIARAEQWNEVMVVAVARDSGFGPAWRGYSEIKPNESINLRLVADEPIEGRVVDLEGHPIEGADVKVIGISANRKGDLTKFLDKLRSGISYFAARDDAEEGAIDDLPPEAKELSWRTKSDRDGRFRLAGLGRERVVNLEINGPGIAATGYPSGIRVVTRQIDPIKADFSDMAGFKDSTSYYGAHFQFAAEPSQPIEGTIRDARTRQPIADVKVMSFKFAGQSIGGIYTLKTHSDKEGHYRLDGMPKGEGNRIIAIPADGQPYFMCEFDVPTGPGLEPVKRDLDLHRGVLIRGRVSDKATGAPVASAHMFFVPWPDNPAIKGLPEFTSRHLLGPQDRYTTDPEGRFTLVGLPGRGLVELVLTAGGPYPPGQGVREVADLPKREELMNVAGGFAPTESFPTAIKEVRINERDDAVTADIALQAGQTIRLNLIDEGGNPLTGVAIDGLWPKQQYHHDETAGPAVDVLALRPDEQRVIVLHQKEQNLGKVIRVSPKDATGPLSVKLERCATITARLLDKDSQPVRGGRIRISLRDGDFGLELPQSSTDTTGHLTYPSVPPGWEYSVMCESSQAGFSTLAQKLTVSPGETIDLGEFDVTKKERPEPKRTPTKLPLPRVEDSPGRREGRGEGAASATQAASSTPDPDLLTIRGRVLDPAGKPVAADVLVLPWFAWYIPSADRLPIAASKSDAAGKFQIQFSKSAYDARQGTVSGQWKLATIVAIAKGFGPAWIEYEDIPRADDLTLQLVPDEPIEGQIVNLEGQPLAGVEVRADRVGANASRDLSKWISDLAAGISYVNSFGNGTTSDPPGRFISANVGPWRTEAITDSAGRFRITQIGRERFVNLRVVGPPAALAELRVVTRPIEPIKIAERASQPDSACMLLGNRFIYSAEPTQPVEGVVRDDKTGQPVPKARVIAEVYGGAYLSGAIGGLIASADEQGRYRLEGLPKSDQNRIRVAPPNGEPYFIRQFEVPSGAPGLAPTKFDLTLHRGIWIAGRVTDRATGQPLRLTEVHYIPWPNNPYFAGLPKLHDSRLPSNGVSTDSDGRYRVVGLPGRGLVGVRCFDRPYPFGQGVREIADLPSKDEFMAAAGLEYPTGDTAVKEMRIADDAKEFTADLQLESGKSVKLAITDPQGQALNDVTIVGGINPKAYYDEPANANATAEVVALWPDEKRLLLLHQKERNLGKAVRVSWQDDGAGPITVKLEPCARAVGRLFSQHGEPLRGARIEFRAERGDYSLSLPAATTDTDGRFIQPAMLPGGNYDIFCESQTVALLARDLTVSPGETIDLGEFDVTKKDRPEPKRTMSPLPSPLAGEGSGVRGTTRAVTATDSNPKENTGTAATNPNPDDPFTIRGRVLDAQGQPVANAPVHVFREAGSTWSDLRQPAKIKTDAEGRFQIEFRKSQYSHPGKPQQWRQFESIAVFPMDRPALWTSIADTGAIDQELTVRLPLDEPIEGRIVDLEGRPVRGAQIELRNITTNQKDDLSAWIAALRRGASQDEAYGIRGPGYGLIGEQRPATWKTATNDDGHFRIAGIGRGREVELVLFGGHVSAAHISVVTLPIEPIAVAKGIRYNPDTIYGSKFTFVAEPTQPVEGTILDAKTRQPIAGARVISESSGTSWKFDGNQGYYVEATSDAAGHYRLEGLPKAEGNQVLATGGDKQPYFGRNFELTGAPNLEPVKFDIELHRGVWINGRATEKTTGKPVESWVLYLPFPDNPNIVGLPEFNSRAIIVDGPQQGLHTDAEGRFRLVGLPGRGIVGLLNHNAALKPFPSTQGLKEIADLPSPEKFVEVSQLFVPQHGAFVAVKEVRIPDRQLETTADIALDEGKNIQLRLVDPQGQPIDGITVWGARPKHFDRDQRGAGPTVDVEALWPDEKRLVLLLQPERKLGKAIQVCWNETGQAPVNVQLQPCSTLKARLLDNAGKPLSHARIRIDAEEGNYALSLHPQLRTDEDGRLSLMVPPDHHYRVLCESSVVGLQNVCSLDTFPGESIDLGEFDVTKEDRPEPKRTQGATGSVGAPVMARSPDGAIAATEGLPASGAAGSARASQNSDSFNIRGQVLDPAGKPAAGARLFVIYWRHTEPPKAPLKPLATTDASGRFEFTLKRADLGPGVEDDWATASIVAAADGFGPAIGTLSDFDSSGKLAGALPQWMKGELDNRPTGKQTFLRLAADDEALAGRIVSLEGKPIAGVKLAIHGILTNDDGALDALEKGDKEQSGVNFYAVPHGISSPILPAIVAAATTDEDGRFAMPGVGRDRVVELMLSGKGIETSFITARTRAGQTIKLGSQPDRASKTASRVVYASGFTHVAGPSNAVVGTVTDRQTGKPLAGITILSQKLAGDPVYGIGQDFIRAVTDAEGHYRLEGMPIGEDNEIGAVALEEPYWPALKRAAIDVKPQPVTLDFRLRRGVWIEGRVSDKATGAPISAAVECFTFASNPILKEAGSGRVDLRTLRRTDAEGRYRVVALPGRGIVGAILDDAYRYPRGAGADSIAGGDRQSGHLMFITEPSICDPGNFNVVAPINPTDGSDPVHLDLNLSAGINLIGKIVDPDGKPANGALYCGDIHYYDAWSKTTDDTFQVKSYQQDQPRRLLFYEPKRNLAAYHLLTGQPPAQLVIRLQPAGTIRGRLVDERGQPLTGAQFQRERARFTAFRDFADKRPLNIPPGPDADLSSLTPEPFTDEQGRFELSGLIPGHEYHIDARAKDKYLGALPVIKVSSGEIKDLGDIVPKDVPAEEFKAMVKEASEMAASAPAGPGSAAGSPGATGSASAMSAGQESEPKMSPAQK